MSKHITDHPRSRTDGGRASRYLAIDRATAGPGAREKALHRAASDGRDRGQRLREFVRIEREAAE